MKEKQADRSQKSFYQLSTLADIHLERFLFVKFSEAMQLKGADYSKIRTQIIQNLLLSQTFTQELTILSSEFAAFDVKDN